MYFYTEHEELESKPYIVIWFIWGFGHLQMGRSHLKLIVAYKERERETPTT